MLVAVLALGTITSISALQDTAEAQIESTAAHIGERRSAVTTPPPPDNGGVVVRSTWGQPVSTQSANQWYAIVSLDVFDDNDAPVSGATVTMMVDQRRGNGSWQQLSEPFDAVTTASGGLVLTSPNVARAGRDPVMQLRFSVLSVSAPGLTWDPQVIDAFAARP